MDEFELVNHISFNLVDLFGHGPNVFRHLLFLLLAKGLVFGVDLFNPLLFVVFKCLFLFPEGFFLLSQLPGFLIQHRLHLLQFIYYGIVDFLFIAGLQLGNAAVYHLLNRHG